MKTSQWRRAVENRCVFSQVFQKLAVIVTLKLVIVAADSNFRKCQTDSDMLCNWEKQEVCVLAIHLPSAGIFSCKFLPRHFRLSRKVAVNFDKPAVNSKKKSAWGLGASDRCNTLGYGPEVTTSFSSRVSILKRDIDIANLSVRLSVRLSVHYVPVPDENGLTYRHSFFTIR